MPKDKIVDEEKEKEPIKYTLVKDLATLSESGENRQKRITIGKWGKNKAKLDIRAWKRKPEDGSWYPTKGVSLSYEEAVQLQKALDESIDKIAEMEEDEDRETKKKKKKKGD